MKTIITVIKYEQEGTEVLNKHKARMGGDNIIAKHCFQVLKATCVFNNCI